MLHRSEMVITRSTLEVAILEGAEVVVHTDDYNFVDIKLMAQAVGRALANGKTPKLHIKGATAMTAPVIIEIVQLAKGAVLIDGR